jgi:hypothetical protein
MRTSSEIKRNNIRKANLVMESSYRKNKGQVADKFGLYEQCGTQLDTDGEYMGAPAGTEPMDMIGGDEMGMMDFDMDIMGDEMGMMDDEMDMMDDDDMPMSMDMVMQLMGEQQSQGGGLDEGIGSDCKPCIGGLGTYGSRTLCTFCTDSEGNPMKSLDDPRSNEEWKASLPKEALMKLDHSDRSEFDGRKSRVVGVDSDIKKQRELKENYKALTATPSRDSWGNKYNNILTESNQVNGVNSLINRMKRVIK